MFYTWLFIVLILAILELSTVNLVSIWFVISGLFAMIASLFTDNFTIQFAIFAIFGLIFLILTRKIVKKITPVKVKTNIDRIVGMEGIVTEKITKSHPGEVKVDGKLWTALSDKPIDKDSLIKVLEINSTKLKVEKLEEK